LCSAAAPGQVLASEGVVHLSQRVDGVRFSAVRTRRFKGIEAPVRLVEVIPETPLPDLPVVPGPKRRRSSTARIVTAVALVVAAVAAVLGVIFLGGGEGSTVGLASNSFSLVASDGGASTPLKLDEAPFGVAVAGKAAWLPRYSDDAVLSVDTATGQPQSIPVGDGPAAVAVGEGSVWVANSGDGTVSEVAGGETVGDPIYVGNGPSGIAVSKGAVWVALSVDGAVAKIDPDTGRVVKTFSVGTNPTRVAFGFDKVWVTNESVGTVTPIDPARGVAGSPIAVGRGPNGITIGAGAVWVTNSLDGSVSRIDPQTLAVNTFPTGGIDPQGVTVVGDTVWVAARRSAQIVRLDAQTGQIRSKLAVGSPPQDVATVGDGAAITTTTSPTEHRGGTFTLVLAGPGMVATTDPDSVESGRPQLTDKLTLTNDGLVSYKRVPGTDGETVVADLAQALPTPTNGGRTYAFQLRRGIRYSTGRPVRATDIRYGLERTFTVNAKYYHDFPTPLDSVPFGTILGAPQCLASPRSCDLSRGIVVDDESGTITFHLRHPDPDLLAKLALPQAVAVPGEVSRRDSGLQPVPATGPYMITHYDIRHAVLERNPYFHEWSRDAQPDGYPDRIVWRLFKQPSQAVSAVEHGTADWLYTFSAITQQQIHEIETNYAAQIHPSAYPGLDLLDIEPNSPLGHDHLARQAIAHAIDRVRLGSMLELASSLVTTCQLIPPNFPGYRPYCPYRLEPALAQKLVHRSPSYGKPVTVFSWAGPPSGRYVVELLKTLGFRARLVPTKKDGFPAEDHLDVQLTGWAMDYLGASDFIQVWPAPLTASELNAVRRKQGVSQYQGTRAWAAADKRIADFAMVIPLSAGSTLGFTSKRVGNYQFAPVIGNSPIIDQMWVR
jgi:ABC-type transport system substrate-binding protein